MLSRSLSLIAGCALALHAVSVSAAQVILQPTASGELFSDVVTEGVGSPGSESYSYTQGLTNLNFDFQGGSAISGFHFESIDGVLVYDLSSVGFEVRSAKLVVEMDASHVTGSGLVVNPIDAVSPQVLSTLPDGPLNNAIGSALRSDIVGSASTLGWSTMQDGVATYTVSFDSDGLAFLNDASGELAIGLWVDTLSFGHSAQLLGVPTLVVSSVPLPAAAWLFASALLALGVCRRRQVALVH